MTRPSANSRASLVRCSWARWMGFRVWKPATRRQPRSRDQRPQRARGQPVPANGRSSGSGRTRDPAAHERARTREQVGHAGMRGVLGAVDLRAPRAAGRARRPRSTSITPQSRPLASRRAAASPASRDRAVGSLHRQGEGQRPDGAVGQAQVLEHAQVVGGAQESGERTGGAGGDQLQVGQLARVEGEGGEKGGALAGAPRLRPRGRCGRRGSPPWGRTRSASASAVSVDMLDWLLYGRCRLDGQGAPRRTGVQAALGLLVAAPAAGAGVLAGTDGTRAGPAADARVALRVERVHGDVVGPHVRPDVVAGPGDERVDLDEAEARVPLHDAARRRGRPSGRGGWT